MHWVGRSAAGDGCYAVEMAVVVVVFVVASDCGG